MSNIITPSPACLVLGMVMLFIAPQYAFANNSLTKKQRYQNREQAKLHRTNKTTELTAKDVKIRLKVAKQLPECKWDISHSSSWKQCVEKICDKIPPRHYCYEDWLDCNLACSTKHP